MNIIWRSLFVAMVSGFCISTSALALPPCGQNLTFESRRFCEKPWTIIVRMAANNELAPYALWDIDEMRSIGSQLGFDIVIGLDLPGQEEMRVYHVGRSPQPFDPRKNQEFYFNRPLDETALTRVPISGREPLPSRRLSQLLRGAQNFFPSRRSMVILWGHGFGWSSRARATSGTAGLLTNDRTGSSLSVPMLRQILGETTVRPEILISDACLMQAAEVVTEFSGFLPRAIGTSQIQDFQSLPYRRFLSIFQETLASSNENEVAYRFSQRVPELFRAFRERYDRPNRTASYLDPMNRLSGSFSSMDLVEWRNRFVPAFRQWIGVVRDSMGRDPLLAPAIKKTRTLSPAYDNRSIELSSFLKLLMNEIKALGYPVTGPLYGQTQIVAERLDQSLTNYFSFDPSTQTRSVSIYVPPNREEWRARRPDFSRSILYQETGLGALFDQLYP